MDWWIDLQSSLESFEAGLAATGHFAGGVVERVGSCPSSSRKPANHSSPVDFKSSCVVEAVCAGSRPPLRIPKPLHLRFHVVVHFDQRRPCSLK